MANWEHPAITKARKEWDRAEKEGLGNVNDYEAAYVRALHEFGTESQTDPVSEVTKGPKKHITQLSEQQKALCGVAQIPYKQLPANESLKRLGAWQKARRGKK